MTHCSLLNKLEAWVKLDTDALISHFDGYLSALRRLSHTWIANVRQFPVSGSLDDSLSKHLGEWIEGVQYVGKSGVTYDEVIDDLDRYILSRLDRLSEDQLSLVRWDIEEYFGLIAMSVDKEADFHPLISGPVYRLQVDSPEDRERYLAVRIADVVVVLLFVPS